MKREMGVCVEVFNADGTKVTKNLSMIDFMVEAMRLTTMVVDGKVNSVRYSLCLIQVKDM